MECLELLFNIVGNFAEWATVIVTAVAVYAAFQAAKYAKGAWKSQVRQEAKSRKQLQIALDQEARHLLALDQERRAKGPFFETIMIGHICDIKFLLESGQEVTNADPKNIFWSPYLVGPIREEDAKDYTLNVILLNKKSEIALLYWSVRAKPERPISMVRFVHHQPLLKFRNEKGNWLLRIPFIWTEEPGFRIHVDIRFETTAGFVDTQTYILTVEKRKMGVGHITFERIDPKGVQDW